MVKTVKTCEYNGCDKRAIKRGYCDTHYHDAVRDGLIITSPRMNTVGSPSKHPLYRCWASMKNRCYNKNDSKNYQWYGAKNIKVCDRWMGPNGFWSFVKDMGKRPKGYSIDRIDVHGDYCPENCRWASAKEQAYNRKNCVKIFVKGKKYTTEEAAKFLNIKPDTLRARWRAGGENWEETKKELEVLL